MYWRRRTGTRILILLIGGGILFVDWLDSVGARTSRLPLRSSPYAFDSLDSLEERNASQPRTFYFQEPFLPSRAAGSYRQQPDCLGLDISLLHQEPDGGGEWVPAGRYGDGWQRRNHSEDASDNELLSQLFHLPELEVQPLGDDPDETAEYSRLD